MCLESKFMRGVCRTRSSVKKTNRAVLKPLSHFDIQDRGRLCSAAEGGSPFLERVSNPSERACCVSSAKISRWEAQVLERGELLFRTVALRASATRSPGRNRCGRRSRKATSDADPSPGYGTVGSHLTRRATPEDLKSSTWGLATLRVFCLTLKYAAQVSA